MKKKILLSILSIPLILSLTSCSHVEDTNGPDDFSIVTYSDAQIVKSNSYLFNNSLETTKNSVTNLSVKKFSGIYQLEKIAANNQDIHYSISSKVTSGNFRIVIVHSEIIVKEVEINTTSEFVINNANGKYLLKIVGESASFSFTYSVYLK